MVTDPPPLRLHVVEWDPNVETLLSAAARKLQLLAEHLATVADNENDGSSREGGGSRG